MLQLSFELACAADVTKLWLSPSVKQRQNPFSGPPPVYQDLSTCHDWPVKKQLSICQSRVVHSAVVRVLASHQCGPGSNPGVDTICELSLLLILSFAPGGFSAGTPVFHSPQKPTLPNFNSIWNTRTRLNKFI